MTSGQITAVDITNWNSLDTIAESFEKCGLKRHPKLSENGELPVQIAEGEFIALIEAEEGESAAEYKPESATRHTHLVATRDYGVFTFITRQRDWDTHGRIKYQQFSFEKEEFRSESEETDDILRRINSICDSDSDSDELTNALTSNQE